MSYLEDRAKVLKTINKLYSGDISFDCASRHVFQYQSRHNTVYKRYLNLLNYKTTNPTDVKDIPCLPIELFKNQSVLTGDWQPEMYFMSSGTTGTARSRHLIRSLEFYLTNAQTAFEQHYDTQLQDCYFVALLPGYLDNPHSSLIAMVKYFMEVSDSDLSGFYADRLDELLESLTKLKSNSDKKIFLFGVSFALLDLAEQYDFDFKDITIIETGGMKGRKKDLTKDEIYKTLQRGLIGAQIHSEYGMTELLSQAYSTERQRYRAAKTMNVFTTQINDPFTLERNGKTGQINIIDLANFDSCAFLRTSDLGVVYDDLSFSVQGRLSNSDIRGCNLLLSDS